MKKILFAAMAAAFALAACNDKTAAVEAAAGEQTTAGGGDLAYVQVEAVLAQSDLFLNEGKALQEKTEKAQQSWTKKQQGLQYEAAQLQEKYQKGLITSFDAQKQQEALQRRAANMESAMQKEGQTLDEENFVFTNRGRDLLMRAVKEVNADGRYRMIVNASALIDADSTLDISDAVLQAVNKLYAADRKSAPKEEKSSDK